MFSLPFSCSANTLTDEEKSMSCVNLAKPFKNQTCNNFKSVVSFELSPIMNAVSFL